MTSTVAWLDTSPDEQRRVRDVLALFAQQESRDELGIGQVRDALSDLLFPGTSVLQTRARYFLIVPWCFQHAAAGSGDVLVAARKAERQLVEVLVKTGDHGVIGRRAGAAVKTLPSAIFWSGIERFGILTRPVSPAQVTGRGRAVLTDGLDEPTTRATCDWHSTLPPVPPGFPWSLEGGLALTCDEADFLRLRIVERARGTLLEHLALAASPPGAAGAPWEDQVCLGAPEQVREVLGLAHGFSLMMNGAALLYNLLVAERYEDAGLTRVADPVETFREEYATWLGRVRGHGSLLAGWRVEALWSVVDRSGARVAPRARAFVEEWTGAVRAGNASTVLGDDKHPLRRLVSDRERSIKGRQSRLVNDKLLGMWSGASGTGRLVYRWPQVRQIVTDIHEGLAGGKEIDA